jgi:hypothetical protein
MRQQPSNFDRITLATWALLVAAVFAAAFIAPYIMDWLAPELLLGDRKTRGTITIVWLILAMTFLILGGVVLRLCGIVLLKPSSANQTSDLLDKPKSPSGENEAENMR